MQFIIVRESLWQELEANGHSVSPVRKQKMNTCFLDCFLLFIGSIILVHWMSLPTFRISPSSLINLRQIIFHRHFPRFVCMVTVNLIELILKFNHREKNYGKYHLLHTRDSDVPKLILQKVTMMRSVLSGNVLEMVSRLYDNDVKHLERLCYKYPFGNINI